MSTYNPDEHSTSDVLELTDPITENSQKKTIKKPTSINNNIKTESDSEDMNLYDDEVENQPFNNNIYKTPSHNTLYHRTKNINTGYQRDDESIISIDSAKETANEIGSLLRTINNKKNKRISKGTTVEDLVIEAIKPYLSSWMNENLSELVKNIVEKEIKKIISEGL